MDEYAVKLTDVSMHFNMASERIESLKDYFIKLTKHQLFFRDFIAVDNVSFEVRKGEVFGIVGTNGSGKSTLLKIISGILEPTAGSVTTVGRIAPLIELGAGFDPNLTARENIFLNGAILGYSEEFIDENFQSIVDFAELWEFLDMPIKNYSSGMVARIAFAIATVVKPDILIVDEILSVGDFLFQQKCERRIRELMANGTTVLIVSHSIDQIRQLCDRVLWIDKGKMIMLGSAQEVCDAYANLVNHAAGETVHEYQIVAEERCSLCGAEVQFRNEKGMTCNTEAYCSNCSAQLRTSDLASRFLELFYGMKNLAVGEIQDSFLDWEILCCSEHSVLSAFFTRYKGFHKLQGNLQQWCDQLESVESLGFEQESLDIIVVENMLDQVNDPIRVFRELVMLLKPGGYILLNFPVYENQLTISTKKEKHRIYRDGVMIRTLFGKDTAQILSLPNIRLDMTEFHHWYEPEEQKNPYKDFDTFISSHPFYYHKFNSWPIIGQKIEND